MKEHEHSHSDPLHRHACLLYRDQNDQKRHVLPFLQEGLRNGEHCLFICPEASVDDWSLEFQAYGIDVVACLETGGLVISTGEEWRRTPFTSLTKARQLWEHIEEYLARFPAIRIVGEASWSLLNPPIASGALCHWEATAGLIYEGMPVQAICMYNLTIHPPPDIRAALKTHSRVILEQGAFQNPYYESDRVLNGDPGLIDTEADAAVIDKMLARLQGM